MNDLKLTQTGYEDEHFGRIDLYYSERFPEERYARKTVKFSSLKDFKNAEKRMTTRINIRNENLIKIASSQANERELSMTICFEYFKSNFDEIRESLKESQHMYQFIKQMIEALSNLETNELVHGDLRPEFICFDPNRQIFKLTDNFEQDMNFFENQKRNYQNGKNMWVSPFVFNQIMNEETRTMINPYKQDMFSLGLIILSVFEPLEQMQWIYSENQGQNAEKLLNRLIEKISSDDSKNTPIKKLLNFVIEHFLTNSVSKRMSPRKAKVQMTSTFQELSISEANFLQQTFLPEESDIPYVSPIPEEKIHLIKEIEKDIKLSYHRDYEEAIPDKKAFPKGEIDFAKRTKILRPIKEVSSKPVPRWEILFVNADMSYKNFNVKGVVNFPKDKQDLSLSVDPINNNRNRVISRPTNTTVNSAFDANFRDSPNLQMNKTNEQITRSLIFKSIPLSQNSSVDRQKHPNLISYEQPRNEPVRVRIVSSTILPAERFNSFKEFNEKTPIDKNKVISNENNVFLIENIPEIKKDKGVEALKRGSNEVQVSAKKVDSSQIVEVLFNKIDHDNKITNLGKGINLDGKKIQYNHNSNGTPVYRYIQ